MIIQSTPLNRVTLVLGCFDPIKRRTQLTETLLLLVISNVMNQFYLLHILVMSSLFNSTLLVYWNNLLVDLAQDLHNTTEFLSSYRCISPKIFRFSLINKTFRLNWENFVPIKRSLSQLTEIFSINLYGDDLVPGEVSQLSGVGM